DTPCFELLAQPDWSDIELRDEGYISQFRRITDPQVLERLAKIRDEMYGAKGARTAKPRHLVAGLNCLFLQEFKNVFVGLELLLLGNLSKYQLGLGAGNHVFPPVFTDFLLGLLYLFQIFLPLDAGLLYVLLEMGEHVQELRVHELL